MSHSIAFRLIRIAFHSLLWLCILIGFLWACGMLYFLNYLPETLRVLLVLIYVAGCMWLLVSHWRQRQTSSSSADQDLDSSPPVKKPIDARIVLGCSIVLIYLLSWGIRPRLDREWDADQAVLPRIHFDQNQQVTIQNLRHARYQTPEDYQVDLETTTFALQDLESVWFVVQRFTPIDSLAHTFISFGFRSPNGPRYFSVSVEVRREKGELWLPLQGIYRQYELMYVVGDERDLIGVRTNIRENDRVYLYRVNATPEQAQTLFVRIAERVERLAEHPEHYHTFLNNCTTNIVAHAYSLTEEPLNPRDLRIVFPGNSAHLAWEKRLIGRPQESFEQLQERSRIDEIARQVGLTEAFSEAIRTGSPQQHAP